MPLAKVWRSLLVRCLRDRWNILASGIQPLQRRILRKEHGRSGRRASRAAGPVCVGRLLMTITAAGRSTARTNRSSIMNREMFLVKSSLVCWSERSNPHAFRPIQTCWYPRWFRRLRPEPSSTGRHTEQLTTAGRGRVTDQETAAACS